MGTATRPPNEVFCMQCGPGTVLQPDRHAPLLRCPRCGAEQQLATHPLFVVTGASGTGKTTIVEPLRRRLPDCEVFETDVILHVAALGWETWRNTWLQLAYAIALNGRATVLCGSLLPAHLEHLPARRLVGPIHCCNLDCPDVVLAERLRARPAWRASSAETAIVEHQRFAAWLRARIQPTFDTSMLSAEEVADHIANWIRPLLGAAQLDRIPPTSPAK
jgi:RNase adaptor protein for sRNA GlmZ degradation/ribosomal protein S27AE